MFQADNALADEVAAAYVRPSALTVPARSPIISTYEQVRPGTPFMLALSLFTPHKGGIWRLAGACCLLEGSCCAGTA